VDEAGSRRRGSRGSKAPTRPWSTTAPQRGAEAHGFRGEVWTCERVAEVIRKEFGVSYHPAHVSRLLKALRQSLQKPQRRAEQRDEEAIEHWKEKKWPSLKKGRSRRAGP
jgi:transposase